MSVLRGEGKVPILFGSTTIVTGSRTRQGYLARPDLTGEWPTVVVAADVGAVSSSVKDLCRKLARHGFAAIAPRLPEEGARATLGAVVEFVRNPAGFWSSAEGGFGVLGIGDGATAAAELAAVHDTDALALVVAPIESHIADSLRRYRGPLLGIAAATDEGDDRERLGTARAAAPQGEWAIYEAKGRFFDIGADDYDDSAAGDVIERLVAFFEKHLPAP